MSKSGSQTQGSLTQQSTLKEQIVACLVAMKQVAQEAEEKAQWDRERLEQEKMKLVRLLQEERKWKEAKVVELARQREEKERRVVELAAEEERKRKEEEERKAEEEAKKARKREAVKRSKRKGRAKNPALDKEDGKLAK